MRLFAARAGGAGVGMDKRCEPVQSAKWARRLGLAAFLFFLIKGLAWLAVPAVLAAWAVR